MEKCYSELKKNSEIGLRYQSPVELLLLLHENFFGEF